jgi:uncharacterized protein (TIGR02145 family)
MKIILTSFAFILICHISSSQNTMTDPRDGNIYETVTINGLTWTRENMRYMALPGASYFDNDKNNLPLYGALYDWNAARQVCPAGWRLPSEDEFRELMNYCDGKDLSWRNSDGNDPTFNIQLGGEQDYEGVFLEIDESAFLWTSTEYDNKNAGYFSFMLYFGKPSIDISRKEDIEDIHGSEKTCRYSVRCLKDLK